MTLDLAADQAVFTADFGESVKVRPSGKPARVVTAVVNRTPFADSGDGPFSGHRMQPCHILFQNNGSTGLTPEDAVETTEIRFPAVLGKKGSNRYRAITKLIRQNAGAITVEVNL